jgi:two-component system, OmpR family, torCAD operon response regulator TorR
MLESSILIVEDDPVTSCLLKACFEKNNYSVTEAVDGAEMRTALEENSIDLILLDINLPGEDGFSLMKGIRKKSEIGIMIVSSRQEDIDRIIGLELGADDYVTKPFNERELLARVKNLLSRTSDHKKTPKCEAVQYNFNGWTLDSESRRLTSRSNEHVHLTNGEFTLLITFVKKSGIALTRKQLLDSVSSREWRPSDRTIDVMVNRLRRKIEENPREPKLFNTVHGVGYQFLPD